MDVLTADELSSVLDHLSLKSICRIAAVCRQLHAASKAKVVDMSALESFCTIERAQEGPMRSALRRPCFVDFCGPSMLAVTNRWDIGRVHLLNVETSRVETSCGSFGGPHDAEETDQELNEPRGVCFDSGSGSGSGSGTLYVVDAKNARLRPHVRGRGFSAGWSLGSQGPNERTIADELVAQDVAVLPDGRLCVTRAFDKQKKRPAIDQCMIIEPAAASKGGAVGSPLTRLRFGPYGTSGGWGQLSQPRGCCGFASEVLTLSLISLPEP